LFSSSYQEIARKELLTKLNDVNKRLGGYNQVNKKAFDQYVSFSEQREGLIARKEELDVGAEVPI
jgi:structural maintenance of chromosome 3 (chondroitin sulfate proteoglycan 6)